jgi:hypothetical protein
VKFRVLAVAVLIVLGIMPAAHADQKTTYRGQVGEGTIKLTVAKRDSGRRFIVGEAVKVTGTCEGGGGFAVGMITGGLNVRVRDDRPLEIDVPSLGPPGSPQLLFHTEGMLGWRLGSGTFTYTKTDAGGDNCTTGELDWAVQRVVPPT